MGSLSPEALGTPHSALSSPIASNTRLSSSSQAEPWLAACRFEKNPVVWATARRDLRKACVQMLPQAAPVVFGRLFEFSESTGQGCLGEPGVVEGCLALL